MSYAIYRGQAIKTLNDLAHIGSHNKRSKSAYKSNPDIRLHSTPFNVHLIPCDKSYVERFYEITKEYRDEYNDRMKNIRSDRKKSFADHVNKSKSCVADEMLFTSDDLFFKKLSDEELKLWSETTLEFIYNDLGYKKEQVIHAVMHKDEKTPHIHCVVVPTGKKYDKRAGKERHTIAKNQYVLDDEHLSDLQSKYHDRLVEAGFDVKRGIKGSDIGHIPTKHLKNMTKRLDRRLEMMNDDLRTNYNALCKIMPRPKIKTIPVVLNGQVYHAIAEFIHLYKEHFEEIKYCEPMRELLEESKDSYYHASKKYEENVKEVNTYLLLNEALKEQYASLKNLIINMLQHLKMMFKKILEIGSEKEKEQVIDEIKEYYRNDFYNEQDLYDITNNTSKEKEIDYFVVREREYE